MTISDKTTIDKSIKFKVYNRRHWKVETLETCRNYTSGKPSVYISEKSPFYMDLHLKDPVSNIPTSL